MNITMRLLLCVSTIIGASCHLYGQTVVIDSNIEFVVDEEFFPSDVNHRGTINEVANAQDFTSVWFNYDGNNLTALTWHLDFESDWYLVQPGDPFGFESLAAGQFTPIFTVDNARPPVFVGSDEFYVRAERRGLIETHHPDIRPKLAQFLNKGNPDKSCPPRDQDVLVR